MKAVIAVNDFNANHLKQIEEKIGHLINLSFVDQFLSDDDFLNHIKDAEIFVGWPRTDLLIKSSVRFLQIGSSGWDSYEKKGLKERGIRLCTAKGVYSIGVAEVGISMMFGLARNINQHFQDKAQGIFKRHEPYGEITGSTACVFGVGEIGATLAQKCFGLGMKVLGVDHYHRDLGYVDQWFSLDELSKAVALADHFFITISGEASNQKLISRELLSQIKEGACLYNMSRGSTVDQAALIEFLKNGKLKGAGLDVTDPEPPLQDEEIYKLDNVILTGHSGGLSGGWKQRLIDLICTNIENYLEGEKLKNELDWINKRINS